MPFWAINYERYSTYLLQVADVILDWIDKHVENSR